MKKWIFLQILICVGLCCSASWAAYELYRKDKMVCQHLKYKAGTYGTGEINSGDFTFDIFMNEVINLHHVKKHPHDPKRCPECNKIYLKWQKDYNKFLEDDEL